MSSSNLKHEQVETGLLQTNPNRHIENYLDYYKGLSDPKFAVLITGEWGVGKTHLIKKLLPCDGEKAEAAYVSLYGLKTTEDIVGAVYEAMHPIQAPASNIAGITAEALKSFTLYGVPIGALGAAGSAAISARLRKTVDLKRVIIFDDLERSSIDPQDVLGVINQYVEHEKCRCIVLSHDEKIEKQISDTKEKVFGQTLRVKPEVNAALSSFIGEISQVAIRDQVKSHFELIKGTFAKSGVPSLRILRQVVFDIARLFGVLKSEHLANPTGMNGLVLLCAAFDFEKRFGYINLDQMKNLPDDKRSGLETKYNSQFSWNMTLPPEVLIDMLFNGHYDQKAICEAIENSSIFKPAAALKPWEIIIRFDTIEDTEVKSAIEQMEKQFKNREITEIGELLHIFALQSLLSEKGVLNSDLNALFSSGKKYVDDIFECGKLEFRGDFNRTFFFADHGAAYGISFWHSKNYKSQFEELAKYIEEKAKTAHEASFTSADLLVVFKTDPLKFCGQISHNGTGKGELVELPVLKTIEPSDFVQAWLEVPKSNRNWHIIQRALEERYLLRAQIRELSSEIPWIKAVVAEMQKRANAVDGLAKFRIERAIPNISFTDENKP